ncbi:unnamed protein product [Brassica rapa subsp. trilocularis]
MADRSMVTPPQPKVISLQGPPGYPLLFPELSNEDPRIERVRQGHVYSYEKQNMNSAGKALAIKESRGAWAREVQSDGEVESSGSHMSNHSAPVQVPTVFRLGPSAEGLTTGNAGSSKAQRRRPPAWKRRSSLKLISVSAQTEAGCSVSVPSASKRKPSEKVGKGNLVPKIEQWIESDVVGRVLWLEEAQRFELQRQNHSS